MAITPNLFKKMTTQIIPFQMKTGLPIYVKNMKMLKKSYLLLSLIYLLSLNVFSQTDYNTISGASGEIETHGPQNGTLLVIGGAASDFFYEKFKELTGGPDAPIVFIPTATTSDVLEEKDLEEFRKSYLEKGFTNVTVLHTRDRNVANSMAFLQPLEEAAGVWFSGGRQWRLADSYLDTKTHQAFFDLLDRGGVIAGSSAGATIQGSYLARGDTKANTIMMGDHEEGLGFITNVAIDQHLLARNRQFDLFEILDYRPGLLGIGLDENTGIIVEGDQFEVIGESYVAIYDRTRWSAERDTVYQLPEGSHDFYLLKEGQKYDLAKRRVIVE